MLMMMSGITKYGAFLQKTDLCINKRAVGSCSIFKVSMYWAELIESIYTNATWMKYAYDIHMGAVTSTFAKVAISHFVESQSIFFRLIPF